MNDAVIHVVDDDRAVRVALRRLLAVQGHAVREHDSAASLLADPTAAEAGCFVLDLRMPGTSGLELQQELARRGVDVPVIFLTGHGDVASSVTAMKTGAVDFLEKPVNADDLYGAIDTALALRASRAGRRVAEEDAAGRVAQLTAREREVLALVITGRRNRQIAEALGVTEQTAKVHRMRGMAKLGIDTVPDLVRLWALVHERAGAAPR